MYVRGPLRSCGTALRPSFKSLLSSLFCKAAAAKAARRWRLQVVRGGPWRVCGLREAVEALEMAEVLRRRRHASGAWSAAQRAESKEAAMAAAAEMRHIARGRGREAAGAGRSGAGAVEVARHAAHVAAASGASWLAPLQGREHGIITCLKYRRYARCAGEGAPLAALAI